MSQPALNTSAGLLVSGGDIDLYRELLELFVTELREVSAELPSVHDQARSELAHRLKGAAAAVGAETVRDESSRVELTPRSDLGPLLTAVAAAAQDARQLVDDLRPSRMIAERDPGSAAPSMPGDAARVLVVDDDPVDVAVMRAALSDSHEVTTTMDPARALTLLTEDEVDLVLADVSMPGVGGFELCRRIKRDPATRDIPVILISSGLAPELEAEGLGLGAADFVHKPVNPALLRARVRIHLTLKKQTDLLRVASHTDVLTGVGNRRQGTAAMDNEWSRHQRSGFPLSVLMIDLDHFKSFNDSAGHPAGDRCLTRVAAALNESLRRPTDQLARWGGEEFLAALPDTPAAGARTVALGMRERVAALGITNPATGRPVTVSIGGATRSRTDVTWADLVARADLSLYRAKSHGRDRFEGDRS